MNEVWLAAQRRGEQRRDALPRPARRSRLVADVQPRVLTEAGHVAYPDPAVYPERYIRWHPRCTAKIGAGAARRSPPASSSRAPAPSSATAAVSCYGGGRTARAHARATSCHSWRCSHAISRQRSSWAAAGNKVASLAPLDRAATSRRQKTQAKCHMPPHAGRAKYNCTGLWSNSARFCTRIRC